MPANAAAVSSVPYDVVSTDEARELAAGNPLSFLHVTRSEIDLPAGHRSRTRRRSTRRRATNLDALRADGAAGRRSTTPALYFYRLRMGAHEQTGVAGCFSVDEYEQDVIKKHERTRRDKEDDRTRHIIELRAQTGVVFLTYKASAAIDRAGRGGSPSAAPLFDFTAPRRRASHHLAADERGDHGSSSTLFAQVPALYIADGHHRAASAARARAELRQPRRRRRGRHVHRGGVSRQPDADPAVQPHGPGSRRPDARSSSSPRCASSSGHRRAGAAAPQGRGRDVSRRPVVRARSRRRRRRRTTRAPARSTSRCCSTTCSSSC